MSRVWPLIGRAEELSFADGAVRRRSNRSGVVLAGEAGVGKTRLAREILAVAARRGMTVHWVTATASAQQLPLGAFAYLLGDLGRDPTRVLASAVRRLVAGAPGGVVLGVDDAHLLDGPSALLVHQIASSAQASVVLTVRVGEPSPDAVTSLWKDGFLQRVEVLRLSQSATGALLEAVLDGPLDHAALTRIWRMTDGNPLYLRQLVEGELEAGRLQRTRGVWRWSGAPQLPPGLVELVDARMGALADDVREVVDLLAISEPLGVELLAELTDPAAVERAETRGVIVVEPTGMLARLAHPLYGETRRARLGSLRTRRLRGQIATALGTGVAKQDTLRRAVLWLDSDLAPDAGLFTVAAREAAQLMDLPQSERLARAAAAAGGGFQAQRVLALTLSYQGRREESAVEMTRLGELADSDVERATASWVRAGDLFWTGRRPTEAERVLDEAEATVVDEDARRMLWAMRAAFDGFLARPARAVALARAALAWPGLPEHAIPVATFGLVAGLGVQGRAAELGPACARGYAAATQSFDAAAMRFSLAQLHLIGLRLAGYVHEAENLAREQREASAGVPGVAQLYCTALAGQASLAAGHLRTAVRELREADAGLSAFETTGHGYLCLLNLTQALAMTGEAAQARVALGEAESGRHPAFRFLDPELMLAHAAVAASEGAITQGITAAHRAAELAALHGQPAHEVLALHVAARLGDSTVADRLVELAAHVQGPRAHAAAAHAVALQADHAPALLAASTALETTGDLVAAADAAAQAASSSTRQGQAGRASAAAARAHDLAAECGARTPAVIAAARPLPLTRREREIATLAAHGLTNRQIAERLVVSVRTVEGHLCRAGAKLDVGDRAGFAALLDTGHESH